MSAFACAFLCNCVCVLACVRACDGMCVCMSLDYVIIVVLCMVSRFSKMHDACILTHLGFWFHQMCVWVAFIMLNVVSCVSAVAHNYIFNLTRRMQHIVDH